MKFISLFSGIEAASVALCPLGYSAVAFSEIDKYASAVLAHHYPNVPNLCDITKIDWSKYDADIVLGGSPCQSFSLAGDRSGLAGESGLMYEYIRAIREIQPRWFLWENVPGVFSVEGGAHSFNSSAKWKNSGMVWRGECLTLNSSEWHKDADVCLLSDILETSHLPSKYYLSAKACQGILSRAARRGRALPKTLKDALEAV